MSKAVFLGELSKGKRDRGAPRRRYKDQLKRQPAHAGVDHKDWQTLASDRVEWRSTTKRAAQQFEYSRVNASVERSRSIKHRLAVIRPSPTTPAQEYVHPELDSSVIRGQAAPSKDFLPTDLRIAKNLPSSL